MKRGPALSRGQQPRRPGSQEGPWETGLAWSSVPPTRGQPRVRNTAFRGLLSGLLRALTQARLSEPGAHWLERVGNSTAGESFCSDGPKPEDHLG